VPRVKYAMDYCPRNSFPMSYASCKVILAGVGHPVAVESSQVVLEVSPLHHNLAANLPRTTQSCSRLCIAEQLVVCAAKHMGSGITAAEGLEVGHQNIE